MLLFLTLFAPLPPANAEQVLQRFQSFTSKLQSLAVECKLSSDKEASTGSAKLMFVKPDQISYDLKWSGIDFGYRGDRHGTMNDEANEKVYVCEPNPAHVGRLYGELSAVASPTYPIFLVGDGTGKYSGLLSDVTSGGRQTFQGVTVDEIDGKIGKMAVKLLIDAEGKPLRYEFSNKGGSVVGELYNYRVNEHIEEGNFAPVPPAGFREITLPLWDRPVGVGDKFPVQSWKSTSGDLSSAISGKDALLVVTDENCDPSSRCAPTLAKLESGGKIAVALLSLSPNGGLPSGLQGHKAFTDPDRFFADKSNFPGTPMFFLVNKSGDIIKVWLGFDPATAASFEEDVLDSAKG